MNIRVRRIVAGLLCMTIILSENSIYALATETVSTETVVESECQEEQPSDEIVAEETAIPGLGTEETTSEETSSEEYSMPDETLSDEELLLDEEILSDEELLSDEEILLEALKELEFYSANIMQASDTTYNLTEEQLFLQCPQYLKWNLMDDVLNRCVSYTVDALNDVSDTETFFASWMYSIKQGDSFLTKEIASLCGITDNNYDEFKKKMAFELIKEYTGTESTLSDISEEISKGYSQVDRGINDFGAVAKNELKEQLKKEKKSLTNDEIDKIVDAAYSKSDLIFNALNETITIADIIISIIEMQDIELTIIDNLLVSLGESYDVDLYEGLLMVRSEITDDIATYVINHYLTGKALGYISKTLTSAMKGLATDITGVKFCIPSKIIANMILDTTAYIWEAFKPSVSDIMYTTIMYNYYKTLESAVCKYQNKFLKHEATAEDIEYFKAAYSGQLCAIKLMMKHAKGLTNNRKTKSGLDIWSQAIGVDYTCQAYIDLCLRDASAAIDAGTLVIKETGSVDKTGDGTVIDDTYDSTESITAKLNVIMQKYVPDVGQTWTGNWGGAIQCFGFVRMVFNKLYGCDMPSSYQRNKRYEYTSNTNVVLVGQLEGNEVTADNIKTLFSKGHIGDVIQGYGTPYGQHTMMLLGVTDDGIKTYECNLNGECGIYTRTYTWSKLASRYGSGDSTSGNGLSLYHALNYEKIYGNGEDLFYDDSVNFVIQDGVLIKYNGWQSFVTIPDTVTAIAENAFKNNTTMISVSIPDGVTTIGARAFYGCSSLLGICIPDSVTSMGFAAFGGCTSLKSADLSKGLISLGGNTFLDCKSLTSIEIPKSLETASSNWAEINRAGEFCGCTQLRNISFETGTTIVAPYLFLNAPALEKIEIPDSVTKIGNSAFKGCSNLKEIALSDNITEIESDAFNNCSSLEEIVLPNHLTTIGTRAFYKCSFSYIDIPDSVTSIGCGAFAFCEKLEDVHLSGKLESLRGNTFANCTSLTSIEIPKSLKTASASQEGNVDKNGEFYGCTQLKNVSFEEGTTQIAPYLFLNAPAIEAIVIPESVTIIGNYAFEGCSNLTEVTLPGQLTEIGARAFYNSALKSIDIPDTVTVMGTQIFRECTALEQVHLPDTLLKVQEYMFYNCDSLKNIDLPETVTTIGQYAFYDCDALESLTMKDAVETMGNYVCSSCDELKNVTLSAKLTAIPKHGFSNCGQLEEIVLPYGIKTISENAFANDVKLSKITIPRNVTSIATTAFSYPDKMTIYGIAGTYAETFAEDNNITFVNHEIPATAVEVLPENPTVNKGYTKQMTLRVTPSDFTDEIAWKSSDTTVATVDQNGLIKGVGLGSTKIKVTVGNVSKSFTITVLQPVTSLSVSPRSISLEAGEESQLSVQISPSNASNKEYTWRSEDESIATVDETGKVTAIAKGTTKVYATASDGSGKNNYCSVTVTSNLHIVDSVDGFESEHPYANNCSDVWEYEDLEADKIIIKFSENTEVEEDFDYIYIYGNSNKLIGKYTGTQLAGKEISIAGTKVRVKLESDGEGSEYGFKIDEVRAIGVERPLDRIALNKNSIELKKGQEEQLQVNYFPENTTDSRIVTWSSDNESVVTVDENGLVRAENAGTASIRAKVGNKVAQCTVTVAIALESVHFSDAEIELGVGDRYRVCVQYLPEDTTESRSLIWSSSNQSVATVDEKGVVHVLDYGETIIEGKSVNNEEIKDTCKILVKQYEVQFDCTGGSQIDSIVCGFNKNFDFEKLVPVKDGHVFVGWYKDNEYLEPWTKDDVVTQDVQLYAKWHEAQEGFWIMPILDQTYTGKTIKPEVKVYAGMTLLNEKKDYTVSYKNNTKVNDGINQETAPTIIVTGMGNYSGQVTANFAILPKEISDADIQIDEFVTKEDGKVQKKIPTVKWNDKKLRYNIDYTVEYPDLAENEDAYKAAGTYLIQINGIGDYTGTKNTTLCIAGEDKELISKAYVAPISAQLYTGEALTPDVTVKCNSVTLIKNVDYTVEYSNNVQVGTATAVITGTGNKYVGKKVVSFTIAGTPLTFVKVSGIPTDVEYTGEEVTFDFFDEENEPFLSITKNNQETKLIEGMDYEVSYLKNVDKGTATVIFTGLNAYSGSIKRYFRIRAYDIEKDAASNEKKITINMGDSFAYEKGGVYPKPVVKFGERVLKEKTDYTLSYRNNGKVNDGSDESKMPTVFINGKGNFEGTVAKTFTITKGNLSEQIITAEDKATGDKGGVFKSTPVITSKTGQKLQAGKDYDESKTAYYYKEETTLKDGTVRDAGALVEDADIIPAGTAIKVVTVGKGNFEGTTLAGEYRVVKYDLSKAHIEIPKKDYTGEEVVLNKDEIVITLDGQTLTADDFEIVGYENNTNRGKAKVTIKGVGDYGGTRTVKFTIKSKLLEWWEDVLEMLFG